MAELLRLYSYWRSSAAYRVRIALNFKELAYEIVPIHLLRDGGEQHTATFCTVNPQELIPVLQHGDQMLSQSLAIIEYLDEVWRTPNLMPVTAKDRHRVRAIAQLIACDVHPLNNLRVQRYLETRYSVPSLARDEWTRHWMSVGFEALEKILVNDSSTGVYCHGDIPTMADCCLVPQVYNAVRFSVDMSQYPTIERINRACLALKPFDAARPENQPDMPVIK